MAFRGRGARKTLEVELQEVDSLRGQGQFSRAATAAQALSSTAPALLQMIQAESSLQAGSLNEAEQLLNAVLEADSQNEEAIALLGQTLFLQGKLAEALTFLDSISIPALGTRLQAASQPAEAVTPQPRSRRSKTPDPPPVVETLNPHQAALLTSAIVTRAKTLDALERPREAADVLRTLLAAVLPTRNRAPRESVSEAVVVLGELYRKAGEGTPAVEVYREALSRGVLDGLAAREVRKKLATLLLAGVCEQVDGGLAPLDEAIELLLHVQREAWEAGVHEQLVTALNATGRFELLAELLEAVQPGIFTRTERWYQLGLAHLAAGNGEKALAVLRMAAKETSGNVSILVAAGKACAMTGFPLEGVRYATTAVVHAEDEYAQYQGQAQHVLGVNLGLQARASQTDAERSVIQNRSVEALQAAVAAEPGAYAPRYDLAVQLAERRMLRPAMEHVGDVLEASNGRHSASWRLLALLLSSEQRFPAAEEVLSAALATNPDPGQQTGLLRTLASVQIAAGNHKQALGTLAKVLGLVKRLGGLWQGDVLAELAQVNVALKEWGNAEEFVVCAKRLEPYHPGAWYASGLILEAQGRPREAMAAYEVAAEAEPTDVRSLLRVASLYSASPAAAPVARSLFTQVLQADPMSHEAWHGLGLLQKADGALDEAADSFQTAIVLEATAPAAPFSSLPNALSLLP